MSSRAAFWLITAFLAVVDAVLLLLSPAVGVVALFLMILAMAVVMLVKPKLWEQIRPHRQRKTADDTLPIMKNAKRMVLERCDASGVDPIVIDSSPFVIGRLGDCDYVLDIPTVSRHHCRISYNENTNNYYIEDLGSRHGTVVKMIRLQPNTPVLLKEGDLIELDKCQFVFKPERG